MVNRSDIFKITYTLEVFQEGEAVSRDHPEGKKHADLSFRVCGWTNNRHSVSPASKRSGASIAAMLFSSTFLTH